MEQKKERDMCKKLKRGTRQQKRSIIFKKGGNCGLIQVFIFHLYLIKSVSREACQFVQQIHFGASYAGVLLLKQLSKMTIFTALHCTASRREGIQGRRRRPSLIRRKIDPCAGSTVAHPRMKLRNVVHLKTKITLLKMLLTSIMTSMV